MATTLSPPISPPPRDSLSRPRTASALSHVSNRSRRSSGSGKMDLTETSRDKKRLNTKADPSRAITEAQPAAVALEDSNLDDLRMMQHKDAEGNLITDPDRSNPTRHRLERPLDTIRSFQAAAEGTSYSRRSSSYQSRPTSQVGFDTAQSRRSSYFGGQGYSPSPQRQRPAMGGYYRSSSYGFRPDSFAEEPAGSEVAYGNYQTPTRPPHAGRYMSSPSYYQSAAVATNASPSHSHQQSYETMTSGSEENGNKSTNPSSQNSSFDHLQQQYRKPEEPPSEYNSHFAPVSTPQPTGFMYNFASQTQPQATQPQAGPSYTNSHANGYGNGYSNGYSNTHPHIQHRQQQYQAGQMGPPPPVKDARVPIKLNSNSTSNGVTGGPVGGMGGAGGSYPREDEFGSPLDKSPSKKRGSWLKRAFSKRG